MLVIYGKGSPMTRFQPLDLHNGVFVTNLIYATIWDNSQLDLVKGIAKDLESQNNGYRFEVRRKGE